MKKLQVVVDWDLCEANGMCVVNAPAVFDIGADDRMRLLSESPAADQLEGVQAAVRSCPRAALSLIEFPRVKDEVLSAEYVLEYTYTRSVGAVMGRFLAGLRDCRIEGVRAPDGRVLVPPSEYDPLTGEAVGEFVEVGQAGVVKTWAWLEEPRPANPLKKPFAWALIQLDGADTALLHAVDAGVAARMKTGMRVRAVWAEQRLGRIQDIHCFVPEEP